MRPSFVAGCTTAQVVLNELAIHLSCLGRLVIRLRFEVREESARSLRRLAIREGPDDPKRGRQAQASILLGSL